MIISGEVSKEKRRIQGGRKGRGVEVYQLLVAGEDAFFLISVSDFTFLPTLL